MECLAQQNWWERQSGNMTYIWLCACCDLHNLRNIYFVLEHTFKPCRDWWLKAKLNITNNFGLKIGLKTRSLKLKSLRRMPLKAISWSMIWSGLVWSAVCSLVWSDPVWSAVWYIRSGLVWSDLIWQYVDNQKQTHFFVPSLEYIFGENQQVLFRSWVWLLKCSGVLRKTELLEYSKIMESAVTSNSAHTHR